VSTCAFVFDFDQVLSSFVHLFVFIIKNICICSKDSPSQCFQGLLLKCEETIVVLLLMIGST